MFTKVMKEELIAGLLKIFGNNISMIILYGSVARNEYTDESDIDIAIVNHDDGDVSNQLVSIIEDFNSSEDEKLFTVHKIDDETKAQEMLKNGSVSTVLIIPQDFTSDMGKNQSSLGEVTVKGNAIDTDYGIASSVIAGILSEFSKEIIKEVSGQTIPEIDLKYDDLDISSSSLFDIYAPGLIVFSYDYNCSCFQCSQ